MLCVCVCVFVYNYVCTFIYTVLYIRTCCAWVLCVCVCLNMCMYVRMCICVPVVPVCASCILYLLCRVYMCYMYTYSLCVVGVCYTGYIIHYSSDDIHLANDSITSQKQIYTWQSRIQCVCECVMHNSKPWASLWKMHLNQNPSMRVSANSMLPYFHHVRLQLSSAL